MAARIKDKKERKRGERGGESRREGRERETNRKMKGQLTGCTLKVFVPLVRLHPGQPMMDPVMGIMYVSLSVK